jgi:hypothetical protein
MVQHSRKTRFQYHDGRRAAAGFRGRTGDCVTRAIATASDLPYREVYDALNALGKQERIRKRKRGRSQARTGVYKETIKAYLLSLGWQWTPTMHIGQGCRVHLRANELPTGALIVVVARHLTAVIDGVIHDTADPSRNGTRCVYGYYCR